MTKETITLTHREQQRMQVLARVEACALRAWEAAQLLGVSLRHVRRLLARVRRTGLKALAHGNRGRPSPRRLPEAVRARVLKLARTRYAGLNDHHLTELLAEREGLRVSRRSVHRLLRAAGIASPRTRRPPRHRRRRDRMPQAGLLVQMDGSHHRWLEERGPQLVLLAALDDATGRVLAAIFRPEEDAHGYFLLLRQLVRRYGLPAALYSDRHSIFHVWARTPQTLAEQLRGQRDLSQIGRALEELGIRWIGAHSPQAKGRIERLFGTFQDRLSAELRLAGARTLTDAQRVLTRFLPRFNARFARRPQDPTPAWRPAPPTDTLKGICCFKALRTVANDNTVQLGEHLFHILPGPGGRSYAHARVEVRTALTGAFAVYYQGQRLPARLGKLRGTTTPPLGWRNRQPHPDPVGVAPDVSHPPKPAMDHPWRRYDVSARRKLLQAQGVTFS